MALRQEITAQIKDVLAKNPQGLSITDIVREIDVNRNTAGRYLDKLLISGQVEMRHFGMAKIYALAHRVPVSAVLSISSELIMQVSGSMRIVFVNEAFAQLLEIPAAQLTGKNIEYTPFPVVFEDIYERFIARVKDGLEGTEWSGEYAPAQLGRVFSCRIAPTALDDGRKGVSVILEDITEKKRADELLQESEARYRILAENSNDLIFMIGKNDRVEYVNSYAAGTLNKKPEDLVGKTRKELFPQDIADRQGGMLQKVFETGEPATNESPMPINGKLLWFDHVLTPVFDREGRVRSVFGVSRDITRRREILGALQISEERFRRIFEDGPLGMTMIGPDMRFTLVNRRFADMLGYTKEELTGRSFDEVTHPAYIETNQANLSRIYAGEVPVVHDEKQYVKKDGSLLWVSVTVTPLRDRDGRILATISIVEDITERKKSETVLQESERRFRELADLLPQSVWECDLKGKITFANQGSFTMYRYSPGDLKKGLCIWQMVSPQDLPMVTALVARAFSNSPEHFPGILEYTAMRKDGSTFPITMYLSPVISDKKITGMRGIGIDKSEIANFEEALRESSERFRAIFDATFQFTGILTPEGILTEANRTALAFTGTRREDVVGRSFWEAGWWRETGDERGKLKAAIGTAAAGKFVRYEVELLGAGGTTMVADFSITPVRDPDGAVRLLIAEARDLTERKRTEELLRESEEKFRRVFEDGPLGMVIVDAGHRFVSVNRMCTEMFGYSQEELLTKTIEDVTCPDHIPESTAEMRKLYEGKIPRYRTQKRYIRKDGTVFWGSLTVSPLKDRTGKITSTIGLVEEIAAPEDRLPVNEDAPKLIRRDAFS